MEKHEFFEVIQEGSWRDQCRILVDAENRWGPIVSREQAEEMWSRFKNSGLSFEEFMKEVG